MQFLALEVAYRKDKRLEIDRTIEMLIATYEFDAFSSEGVGIEVSPDEAKVLAKKLIDHEGGFVSLINESEEILQFGWADGSLIIDIPDSEKEASQTAMVDQDGFMKVVDGLFEPLGAFISTLFLGKLLFEITHWGGEDEGGDEWEEECVPDKDQLRSAEIEAMPHAEFMQLSVEERFEFFKTRKFGWRTNSFLADGHERHWEEYTPELLAYEDKIHALEEVLQPIRRARGDSMFTKNENLELSLTLKIISLWHSLTPVKKYAVDRSQIDHFINRASIIQMRQGRIEDAISTINSYYAGPFCAAGGRVSQASQDAIQKRLKRAEKMLSAR